MIQSLSAVSKLSPLLHFAANVGLFEPAGFGSDTPVPDPSTVTAGKPAVGAGKSVPVEPPATPIGELPTAVPGIGLPGIGAGTVVGAPAGGAVVVPWAGAMSGGFRSANAEDRGGPAGRTSGATGIPGGTRTG